MTEAIAARLSLGRLLAGALHFARRRWATLLVLLVCLDWGPRVLIDLSGTHIYSPSSHDPAAFAAFAFQSSLLAVGSLSMQASALAAGLGGLRAPVSAGRAIAQVLQRLPKLAPWWLLMAAATVTTLWIRWTSNSYAEMHATYLWREIGATTFAVTLDCLIGLFPLVVLGEGLGSLPALRRTARLMAGRRGVVFVVAFASDMVGLLINLATPNLTLVAVEMGLGRTGILGAVYLSSFGWEAAAIIANLVYVELYRELARAHDGVTPGELDHIFA